MQNAYTQDLNGFLWACLPQVYQLQAAISSAHAETPKEHVTSSSDLDKKHTNIMSFLSASSSEYEYARAYQIGEKHIRVT